jgi:hypothetical protein
MTNNNIFTRSEVRLMENEYYNKVEQNSKNRCWHLNDSGVPDRFCMCGGTQPAVLQEWINISNKLTGTLRYMINQGIEEIDLEIF